MFDFLTSRIDRVWNEAEEETVELSDEAGRVNNYVIAFIAVQQVVCRIKEFVKAFQNRNNPPGPPTDKED